MTMSDSEPPKPERHPFRFSLRTLLILVLVLGVFFGWLGTRLKRARENRLAEAKIRSVNASGGLAVFYSHAKGSPNWLERMLGDPGVISVQKVTTRRHTENGLKHLRDLHGMLHHWELDLSRPDGSLGAVTDAELKHLKGLAGLQSLDLSCQSSITDTGLEHLEGLASLRQLRLDDTAVTSIGVDSLQRALPEARITPSSRQFAAIAEIKRLGGYVRTNANWVSVSFSESGDHNATDAVMLEIRALANLRSQLDVSISGDRINDAGMVHLKDLTNLNRLHVHCTQVTDAGLECLKEAKSLEYLRCHAPRVSDVSGGPDSLHDWGSF